MGQDQGRLLREPTNSELGALVRQMARQVAQDATPRGMTVLLDDLWTLVGVEPSLAQSERDRGLLEGPPGEPTATG